LPARCLSPFSTIMAQSTKASGSRKATNGKFAKAENSHDCRREFDCLCWNNDRMLDDNTGVPAIGLERNATGDYNAWREKTSVVTVDHHMEGARLLCASQKKN